MLYHVMVGSNDIQRSKQFYDAVLAVVGVRPAMENVNNTGQTRLFYMHNGSIFGVTEPINGQAATPANGSTIGFECDSLEQITALHEAAIANGGTSVEDGPGLRTSNMGSMNLCYFLDPDGNKICGIQLVD